MREGAPAPKLDLTFPLLLIPTDKYSFFKKLIRKSPYFFSPRLRVVHTKGKGGETSKYSQPSPWGVDTCLKRITLLSSLPASAGFK